MIAFFTTDSVFISLNYKIDYKKVILRWTDTGSRVMAAILFLITYQNIQKWFKIYQICAFNNFPAHFGRISARGAKIFENSN